MSTNGQTPLGQPMSVVRNTLGKEPVLQELGRPISVEALREYCDRNYHQILSIIAEKVHQEKVQQEKLKAVKARLNFEETSHHFESGTPTRRRGLKERLGPRHVHSRSGSPCQDARETHKRRVCLILRSELNAVGSLTTARKKSSHRDTESCAPTKFPIKNNEARYEMTFIRQKGTSKE
ncbi:hypothetical protein Tco_0410822 [Tanacetum coccineum]